MAHIDEIMSEMERLRGADEAFALATVVRTRDATSAKAGARAVVRRDGEIVGWIGGGCVQAAVRKTALEVMAGAQAQARLIRVLPAERVATPLDVDGVELHKSACPSGGTVEIFIEAMLPRPQLIVFGASPVAVAVAVLGRRLGFSLTVVAPEDMQARFAEADARRTGYDVLEISDPDRAFIVVATQGRGDREALSAALHSQVSYVAFVGSRKKAALLSRQLLDQGLERAAVGRLKAPAGLDIGAIGHEEIALSILAEIVKCRRHGLTVGQADEGREAVEAGKSSAIVSPKRSAGPL